MLLRTCCFCIIWFGLLLFLAEAEGKNANKDQLRIIKAKMNTTVDPCDNYHQYACGKWDSFHETNDYYETIGLIDFKVNKEYMRMFRNMKKDYSGEPDFIQKANDYYKSCIGLMKLQPLRYLEIFEEVEGLPVMELFTERRRKHKCDWIALLAAMRKYDMNGIIIEELVIQDPDDSMRSLVDIDMPVMNEGLKPLLYKDFRLVMKYLELDDSEEWMNFWHEIEAFENRLKALEKELSDVDDEDVAEGEEEAEYNEETQKIKSYVNVKPQWIKEYLRLLLGRNGLATMRISLQHETYLSRVYTYIEDLNEEFISRYLVVRFLWHLHLTMPNSFFRIDCVSHTRGMFPLAMQFMYEKFNPGVLASFNDISNMFKRLVTQFSNTLENNANHFDDEVMNFLRSKLRTKKLKIGNLPRRNTLEVLTVLHTSLEIDKDNFYKNHLMGLSFGFRNIHDLLRKRLTTDKDDFYHLQDRETGSNSSPYYLARYNTVVIPSTLLHTPIYHLNFYDLFKYSSLGFLLAHEIVHGFDLSGIMFDKDGNVQGPSDYIFRNTLFDSNVDCLKKRSSKVIDEKIADVSGLRLSYYLYFGNANHAERSAKSAVSQDFSSEELFFLNFAQFFCGTINTDYSESLSDHGSDQQRLIDALANFDKFAEAYHCPQGSPMNPVTKCHIWR